MPKKATGSGGRFHAESGIQRSTVSVSGGIRQELDLPIDSIRAKRPREIHASVQQRHKSVVGCI
ncbi:MAG: hypothetical protein ACRC8A_12930 [Microcoleaceae cyanobacterium]